MPDSADERGSSLPAHAPLDREQAHAIRGALNSVAVSADVLRHLASVDPDADPTRESRLRSFATKLTEQIRELARILEAGPLASRRTSERGGDA